MGVTDPSDDSYEEENEVECMRIQARLVKKVGKMKERMTPTKLFPSHLCSNEFVAYMSYCGTL